jgi:superfamily I DNA/RNA helicase/plasmid maintenance system killer protein
MSRTDLLEVSIASMCSASVKALPRNVQLRFAEMTTKFFAAPERDGLNFETVQGARDKHFKSIRIDQAYRAIVYLKGNQVLFLHANSHDDAYRWAASREMRFDGNTGRVRLVEIEVVKEQEHVPVPAPQPTERPLFEAFDDALLLSLGVLQEELPKVRRIQSEAQLEAETDSLDGTTFDILVALAAGIDPTEVPGLIGASATPEEDLFDEEGEVDFRKALRTDSSRREIFIPESETELRRFLDGDLQGWRVFLHPEQRKLAYRDYNGPVLVRGGAGTGKTVVAMHRAKHLADQIEADPGREGQKILFTTFTRNLAGDIQANLKTLCPQHIERGRIEVINLDAWVKEFLGRRAFDRRIAYFGEDVARIGEIWDEIFARTPVPEGLTPEFVRNEWTQIVQAKGLLSREEYFKASRAGRGTALDRRKRAALWPMFETYRARLVDEGIAEPDDAFGEAIALLGGSGVSLPYVAVVVDEAQDMGEQAFRLLRAIVPPGADDSNSLFFVGDAHQRIYARRASMGQCGIDVRGRSRRLKLNYRTTEQIRNWAVALLKGMSADDMDGAQDELSGYRSIMSGPAPELHGYRSFNEEAAALVDWIKVTAADDGALSRIGVLGRTNRDVDALEKALAGAGIATVRLASTQPDDPRRVGVRLATMHRAKGLEFERVAMAGLTADGLPPRVAKCEAVDAASEREMVERERSLIHVAATRAKKELRISWCGMRPNLLPK